MKKKVFRAAISLGLVVSFLYLAINSQKAEAIPTLSRKYKTTCMTCHATYPRLTALGEAIRLNGYKMPEGDEIYIKEEVVSQGAEAYKRVFPHAVWPSTIPGPPPISIRVIGDLQTDIGSEGDLRDNETKVEFPHEVELLALGAFGDNMSFHLELEFEHPGEEVVGVEGTFPGGLKEGGTYEGPAEIGLEGWLMWEDIVGENFANVRLGDVGMHEIALPNTRDNNRITKEHYFYRDKVTKGLDGPGVEVNGFGRSWRYAAGLVKPQDTFGDANYYAQAALKIGGLGFDGSGGAGEAGGLKTSPTGYWRDDALLLGGFFYRGDDEIDRYGTDARWNFKDLSLAAGWAIADDRATNINKTVWFGEAEYFVLPWFQPFLRYERLSDDTPKKDQAKLLVGTVLLARANVKFNVEGRFFTDNDPAEDKGKDKNIDNRLFVRLDYAF